MWVMENVDVSIILQALQGFQEERTFDFLAPLPPQKPESMEIPLLKTFLMAIFYPPVKFLLCILTQLK